MIRTWLRGTSTPALTSYVWEKRISPVLTGSLNGGFPLWQVCVQGGQPPSGGWINSFATYYEPNGGTGACETPLQNDDMIVALSIADMGGQFPYKNCGKCMSVRLFVVVSLLLVSPSMSRHRPLRSPFIWIKHRKLPPHSNLDRGPCAWTHN